MKVSGDLVDRLSSGLGALWQVSTRQGLVVHLGVLACYLAWALRREGRRVLGSLPFEAFFGLAWVGYFVYLGGDVLFDRFLVPIFPLGVLLALRWSEQWGGNRPAKLRLVLLTLVLGAAQLAPLLSDPPVAFQKDKYDRWVTLGRHLREHHPDAVLAIDAAGKVPFFSGLRTIDMLGLNDEHVAHLDARSGFRVGHNKYDPDYVLGRSARPDRGVDQAQPGSVVGDRPGPLHARRVPDPLPLQHAPAAAGAGHHRRLGKEAVGDPKAGASWPRLRRAGAKAVTRSTDPAELLQSAHFRCAAYSPSPNPCRRDSVAAASR